jgi:predicted O-linked N-acetylglucosamine transferase (SPINDLY family)
MQPNGEPKQPAIAIFWNPETQSAHVNFDDAQLKNLDMVSAVLHVAQEAIRDQVRFNRMMAMQQQAMQAQRLGQVAQKIIHKGG